MWKKRRGVGEHDALFKKYREWMLANNYRPTGAANFKKAVKRIFPKSYEKRERVGLRQMTAFYNIMVMSDLPTGVQGVQTQYIPIYKT